MFIKTIHFSKFSNEVQFSKIPSEFMEIFWSQKYIFSFITPCENPYFIDIPPIISTSKEDLGQSIECGVNPGACYVPASRAHSLFTMFYDRLLVAIFSGSHWIFEFPLQFKLAADRYSQYQIR